MNLNHESKRRSTLVFAACALLAACGGGGASVAGNCELLTNEEVSELAGFEVVAGQDSPLGCPFTRPGDLTAQVTVGSAELSGDAQSVARQGYPQAADIIEIEDVGSDTVAVLTPTGGTVAAIVTAGKGRFVELGIFMLGVEPDDEEGMRRAANLAVVALDRL